MDEWRDSCRNVRTGTNSREPIILWCHVLVGYFCCFPETGTHVQSNNQFHKSVSSWLLFYESASDWLSTLHPSFASHARPVLELHNILLGYPESSWNFFTRQVICVVSPLHCQNLSEIWLSWKNLCGAAINNEFCKFHYSKEKRWTNEDANASVSIICLLIRIQANYHGIHRVALNSTWPWTGKTLLIRRYPCHHARVCGAGGDERKIATEPDYYSSTKYDLLLRAKSPTAAATTTTWTAAGTMNPINNTIIVIIMDNIVMVGFI